MSHKANDEYIEKIRDERMEILGGHYMTEEDVFSDEDGDFILVVEESGSPSEEDYSVTTRRIDLPGFPPGKSYEETD